jgi:indolepyruvate ferredoxin oxidoreductase
MNKKAFAYGRLAASDMEKLETLVAKVKGEGDDETISKTLDELIDRRKIFLTSYQDNKYAQRYSDKVSALRSLEEDVIANSDKLAEAVARYYYKLLAYKDEYEVARLYTDPAFKKALKAQFAGNYKIAFNLAPPILERKDPATGRPKKTEFGPWMMIGFKVLSKLKGLRGSMFDVFGYHKDRKAERALIKQYEEDMDLVLSILNSGNHAKCIELLSVPEIIKGYGPVKEENIKKAAVLREELLSELGDDKTISKAA